MAASWNLAFSRQLRSSAVEAVMASLCSLGAFTKDVAYFVFELGRDITTKQPPISDRILNTRFYEPVDIADIIRRQLDPGAHQKLRGYVGVHLHGGKNLGRILGLLFLIVRIRESDE